MAWAHSSLMTSREALEIKVPGRAAKSPHPPPGSHLPTQEAQGLAWEQGAISPSWAQSSWGDEPQPEADMSTQDVARTGFGGGGEGGSRIWLA